MEFIKLENFLNQYYIYCIYNETHDKYYIGCTSRLFARVRQHAFEHYRGSEELYNDVKELGASEFSIVVLAHVNNKEEAYQKELEWIIKFYEEGKKLYNKHKSKLYPPERWIENFLKEDSK